MSDKEINPFCLHRLVETLQDLDIWVKKLDNLPEYIERCHKNVNSYSSELTKIFGKEKTESILDIIRNKRYKENKKKIEAILKEIDCLEKYKFVNRIKNFCYSNCNCQICYTNGHICEECLKKAKESGWKNREKWDYKNKNHWISEP